LTVLDYEHARHRMVDAHIARRGVRDERVLAALRKVARETFVDAGFEEFAYEDSPLPIGSGQTISQPFIVARMAEAAEIEPSDRVLEIALDRGIRRPFWPSSARMFSPRNAMASWRTEPRSG
jgi:hypothetical protein